MPIHGCCLFSVLGLQVLPPSILLEESPPVVPIISVGALALSTVLLLIMTTRRGCNLRHHDDYGSCFRHLPLWPFWCHALLGVQTLLVTAAPLTPGAGCHGLWSFCSDYGASMGCAQWQASALAWACRLPCFQNMHWCGHSAIGVGITPIGVGMLLATEASPTLSVDRET